MSDTEKKDKAIWIFLGPLFVIIGAGLWGTETIFRKGLLETLDAEVLVFHEHLFCILFTIPCLFLIPWKGLKKIPVSAWVYLLLSGALGSALGTTFFTLSLTKLNASVANVLLNFQPIISVVSAYLLLNEKLGKGFFFWAAIALGCGFVIAAGDFSFQHQFHWNIGLLYIGITALAWGFSTVAGRGAMRAMPLSVGTFGRFLIGAVSLWISLSLKGKFTPEIMKWSALLEPSVIKNYVWLSLFAGVIPLFFYFKGLQHTGASVGGFCELTQTFSAILITWGIMHEPLTSTQVAAGTALLFAVYMINWNFAKSNRITAGVPG